MALFINFRDIGGSYEIGWSTTQFNQTHRHTNKRSKITTTSLSRIRKLTSKTSSIPRNIGEIRIYMAGIQVLDHYRCWVIKPYPYMNQGYT